MEAVLQAVATTCVNAILTGFESLARAKQAMNADEKNRHVSEAGLYLAKIGYMTLVLAVAILLVLLGKSTVPFPPIILCFIFFTGLIPFGVGLFLWVNNNSGEYITLACFTMWAATIGAVLALATTIAGWILLF